MTVSNSDKRDIIDRISAIGVVLQTVNQFDIFLKNHFPGLYQRVQGRTHDLWQWVRVQFGW